MTGFSNSTRGVSGGGSSPYIDVIEYVVLASVGTDGLDFGNLSANRSYMGGLHLQPEAYLLEVSLLAHR